MIGRLGVLCLAAIACGPPPRSDFARDPATPVTRDPSQSDPRALAIADRVFAAAGGAHWHAARELRWTQIRIPAMAPDRPSHDVARHLWDRWNGRYAVRTPWRDAASMTAFFEIYRNDFKLVVHDAKGNIMPGTVVAEYNGGTRAMWAIDTALVSLPFQLHEPGARIADRGPLYGDTGEVEQLELTFSAGDRADLVIGLVVTRSDVIQRVSIERRETHWHASYELADWTTVAGLAIPTTLRADDGDAVRIGDLAIEDRVENDDFVWPSQR